MEPWVAIIASLYLLAGAFGARWSFHNGNHRPDASMTARVVSSLLVGLVWPGIIIDLWLLDPNHTRRRNDS